MRSLSVFSSFIAVMFRSALPQSVAERDAVVKAKTFAMPAALGFRHVFQIVQDSAFEMIDLGKTARQQIGAGLFAADAAGAEHRDPPMLCRIEMARRKFLKLAKTLEAGIDGARESAQRDLEGVTRVDQERVRRSDQIIPVGGVDIDAHPSRRIGRRSAEGDAFLPQPDFQSLERHV